MSRLPIVGGDFGGWGSILNDFLSVSLNADGTLKGSVNVTATGSTTARSLSTRFSEIKNVKDFGAVGDNVTDDTAAIKAAIAAITTLFDGTGSGGMVLFPVGTYKISSVVEVPPNIILQGLGRFSTNVTGSALNKTHDGVAVRFVRRNAAPGNLFHMGGIADMGISGQGATDTTASRLIELGDSTAVTTSTGAWNVFINRCMFNFTNGYGVYSAHSQEALIDGNFFTSVKFPIYYNTVAASARITRNSLLDPSVISGAVGMQFRPGTLGGASGLHISGNYLLGFKYGIWVTSILGVQVHDNVLESTQKSPIVFEKFLSDGVTQDGTGCLSGLCGNNTMSAWASDATDNPAIQLNYAQNFWIGTNAYNSPNGAATLCLKLFDDGVDKVQNNLIVAPVRSGTGTAAPLQVNSTFLTQNHLLGQSYLQLKTTAGLPSVVGFGAGEDGRVFYDTTNHRILHFNSANSSAVPVYFSGASIPTYSSPITIDLTLGNVFVITASNNTAFTISNPTNTSSQQTIHIVIRNGAGAPLGAATWSGNYRLAGAWTQPGSGNSRAITFTNFGGTWYELSRTAADMAN